MKITKRIPIFLAGLTLMVTGVGGNFSVEALDGVSQELLSVAREATEDFTVKTNALNPYLRINTITSTGGVSGMVSVPEGEDWYIKKIVVAYINFRQGVSEEEADQNLANLTGSKDGNWNIMSLYENYNVATKKSQEIVLNQSQKKKIYANEPDMIYYAVELGIIVDGKWAETQWSRGKIDYRSCIHSAVFDRETMSCVRVEDGEMMKYQPKINTSGILVELPENEKVITWEDEWRDIILADYEAMQGELELMGKYLDNGLAILDEDDSTLDGILKSAKHYDAADSKLLWIGQGVEFWKGRIAEMRKFYEKEDAVDTSRLEILEKENETLKQVSVTLESEKMALEEERDALTTAGEELKREKGELEEEILRLRAENATLKAENDALKAGNNKEQGDNEAMGEIENLKQEIERMTKKMTEMGQKAERLETEKAEISIKNVELEQDMSEIRAKNVELMQEIDRIRTEVVENVQDVPEMAEGAPVAPEITADTQRCGIVNVATEVKEVEKVDGDEQKLGESGLEKVQDGEDKEVIVPNLGEEVRTNGVWWWLIPVVGLAGVVILLARRKFARR